MAGGRQHRAFIGPRLQPTNGSVDPDPPSIHIQLLHHTTSSFYHIVPLVRVYCTLTYHDVHGFGVISKTRIELATRTSHVLFNNGPKFASNGCRLHQVIEYVHAIDISEN